MIYSFTLQQAGVAIGLLLIAFHSFALLQQDLCSRWLLAFPRSRPAGIILILMAGIWSFLLVRSMDLGEFAPARNLISIAVVVGTVLAAVYMPEFLSVRALGMLLLLAAEPVLSSAFLRPEVTRLFLVVLAYGWILAGLFWVGMPWLLRDEIRWITERSRRFRSAAIFGVGYGVVVLMCAVLFWG